MKMGLKPMLYISLLLLSSVEIIAFSLDEAETAETSSDLNGFRLPFFDINGRVRRDTGVADTDADAKDADDTDTDYTDSDTQEEELFETPNYNIFKMLKGDVIPGIREFQDDHTYYTSKLFYIDDIDLYWIPLQNDSKHHVLSNTFMYGVRENVTFDFRFYGHNIHNVVLTNAGFISTSPLFHNKMDDTQYIAPYMAPYDPTLREQSVVLYEVIGKEKFVVEWKDVFVLYNDNLIGPFHFQAIIHKDGRIMFLYKQLPASFDGITVGLAESVWFDTDRPMIKKYYNYNKVAINSTLIKNGTVVSIFPLPTCNLATDCEKCVSRNISFHCKWCDVLDKCSDGLDRHSQAWYFSGCYSNATSDCNDRSTDDPDTSGAQPGTTKTIDPSYTTEAHSKHMTSKPSSSLTEKPKTSSATATGVSTSAAETSTVGPKTSALSTSGVKSSAQTSSSPQTGALSSAGPKTNHPSTSGPATAYLQTGAHSAASAESHTSIKHTENQQTTGGQEISTDTSNNKKTTRTLGNGADMGAQRSGAIADNSGSTDTAMIAVLVVVGVALVVFVCGVFLYSYTHPTSRSAIWFLEHRPSTLVVRFRRRHNQEPTETTPVTQA